MPAVVLDSNEIAFLLDSLEWAQVGFEEKASKYLYGQPPDHRPMEGYRENHYEPTMKMFAATKKKLRSVR